jgi:recombination protein RecA
VTTVQEVLQTLEEWGDKWNKQVGGEVAYNPNDPTLFPPPIPTGYPTLDEMMGGGIPRGRVTMLIGLESAGKTLLSQLMIAAAQRQGGRAVFIDAERTFDPRWFSMTGVDLDPKRLLVVRPETLEQSFDMLADALRNLEPDIIVWDSITSLLPSSIMDASMVDSDNRGVAARKTTEGITRTVGLNKKVAVVVINQIRTDMTVKWGNPESSPGGFALKHHTSLRLRVRRGEWVYAGGKTAVGPENPEAFLDLGDEKSKKKIGYLMRIRADKNKIAPPYQEIELTVMFNGTVDGVASLVHNAIARGVIEQPTAGYFVIPDTCGRKIHGRPAVENIVRQDDEIYERVRDLNAAAAAAHGPVIEGSPEWYEERAAADAN